MALYFVKNQIVEIPDYQRVAGGFKPVAEHSEDDKRTGMFVPFLGKTYDYKSYLTYHKFCDYRYISARELDQNGFIIWERW